MSCHSPSEMPLKIKLGLLRLVWNNPLAILTAHLWVFGSTVCWAAQEAQVYVS